MLQILLSTYNGAKYLRAQMDSLLAQDYPHIEILVRDDGSTDGTLDLLGDYAANCPNVKVVRGENVGFAQSFLKLLELSAPTAEYFAFCDQDDVWHPDKMSRAVELLSNRPPEIPALYCARRAVVDQDLQPLRYTAIPRRGLSFRNALVEAPVVGCTTVLNRAARHLLLRELPQFALSHDWWSYLAVAACGTLIYDAEPRMLYRMHGYNTVGTSVGVLSALKAKAQRFIKYGGLRPVAKQAEEFRRIYRASLSPAHRQTLERFLRQGNSHRPADRLRYIRTCDVYRQSATDQVILKLLILLRRL